MSRWLHVWLDKGVPGVPPSEHFQKLDEDDDSDEIGSDVLDTLIGNELDTGWQELDESEVPEEYKR